jgi:lipopolysaccharide transport system permease protein
MHRREALIVENETPRSELEPPRLQARRGERWIENRPASSWGTLDLREIWAYRELGLTFALKDVKVRYKQTFFGVAWVIVQPLLAVLIFTVIFGRLAHLPADGIPYPVFVYTGMTVWLYFSSAVTSAAQSLVENRDLVSKVYFPRVLAPAAAVAPGLLDLGISLGVLTILMAAYGVQPGPQLALFPVWILATVMFAFAVGLWLSALNVQYRDVKYVLGFLMQIWLYASPVVYAASLVKGDWTYLFAANPMVSLLNGFRWSLVGTPAPGREALVSLAVGVLVLLSGVGYFRRVESYFSDLV